MKTVLIVQARMGSTRLPGKVAKPMLGIPMLRRELDRLKLVKNVDQILVATSTNSEDGAVETIAKAAGVTCFRGSEKNVLDRYYQAAKSIGAETVVRVTGDCPLHDAHVVDEVIEHFRETGCDYTKQPENYPEGTDTEVFSFKVLELAWQSGTLPSEKEHVTVYIRSHPELFRLALWTNGDFDYSAMHWSVDTGADFEFVSKVFEYFGDKEFHMKDIISLLNANPELAKINAGGTGYEGLEKSLKEDEEWRKNHANG